MIEAIQAWIVAALIVTLRRQSHGMRGPFRIEGYAIVCSDGAIADATGFMPDSLKLEADQRFFAKALDGAAIVVHGRISHEGQPNSPKRRRLTLTRRVKALAPDPNNANARFWNPAGASLEEACAAVGCPAGGVAVLGGPQVYGHFLAIGYDRFYLSRAHRVSLRGGLPVFPQGRLGLSPEKVLSTAGLKASKARRLGEDVSLVEWTPIGPPAFTSPPPY
jgi:dihydrofolate reductase